MDKAKYTTEGHSQQSNAKFYEFTFEDLIGEVIHRVNLYVHDIIKGNKSQKKICSYLNTDTERAKKFYMLPKIHKDSKIHQTDSGQWRTN